MPKSRLLPIVVLALLSSAPRMAQADSQGLEVLADIPISGALTQMVLGELGQVHVLLPPGADAHDYQLRPSQARAVQDADLHVWIGAAMSPWMQRALDSAARGAPSLALLDVPGTMLLPIHEPAEDHHDHEHDHHDHGPIDPHAWLDPANAQLWLGAIAAQLSSLDPKNDAIYRHNAESAGTSIASLQAELTTQLAPYSEARFVVQHDAYAYFTHAFGLQDAIPIATSDAVRPSAARLRQIQQELAAQNVRCAFPEQNHDDRLLRAAIEGSATRLAAPLDPEGSAIPPIPDLYPTVLRNLAQALDDCLGNNNN